MSPKISGTLPGGDGNGLVAIMADLISDPKKMHVAICIVDGKKITTDADTGETVPTARVRRIEVIQDRGDQEVLRRLMRRALDQRTGREGLPYDLEAEIEDAIGPLTEDDE